VAGPCKTRFAPSPTGRLHVGNARVALVNWLLARGRGGRFLLRLDDTDVERSTDAFAEGIQADLEWLGLGWDKLVRQSDRLDRYAAAIAALRERDRLYPCYETPEELELKRKAQLQVGRPPIYDRAALRLSDAERRRLEAEGRRPHWRFRLAHRSIEWHDMVRGTVAFEGEHLSDPVLVRADGRVLYGLSSVVDDIELAVSYVVRGEDHVANTAAQIQMFQALDADVPAFGHLPLLTDAHGEGLSKRFGSLSLAELRAEGIEPMALDAYLARLGTPDSMRPHATVEELIDGFDIGRFGRATPKFDPQELARLNARTLNVLPLAAVHDRLESLGVGDVDEALWQAVRPNIARLDEIIVWHEICLGTLSPVIEDAELCATAADLLPPEPWDADTWKAWTDAVKTRTGRRGRALFHPLRLALTGREAGPELKALLPLIGRPRAAARLNGRIA
jgi:glutamyl-tRNA synthetase